MKTLVKTAAYTRPTGHNVKPVTKWYRNTEQQAGGWGKKCLSLESLDKDRLCPVPE